MKRLGAPLGASLVVLSSLFYASYGIWTRLMGTFFGGYTASAIRSVLVLLLLLPVAALYHKFEPVKLRRNWPYLAGMIVSSFLIWGPLYFAILQAGIGVSLAINYACVVMGLFVFGWLLAGEKFGKDKALSAGIGIVGLGLVFAPNIEGFGWLALLAAAISGFASASNMVLAKKIPYNATQSAVFIWITSVIANVLMAFVFSETQPMIGWHIQWLYMVFFAVSSVIASWSFIKGIKLIDAGAAGVIGLLEIVFAVGFGAFLFAEHPNMITIAGVIVIIIAASIPYIKDYNARRGTLEG